MVVIFAGTSVAAGRQPGVVVAKRSSSRRELINTGTNKSFAKRDSKGQFKEMDDVGRSLASDRRTKARGKVKSGHGDRGDR